MTREAALDEGLSILVDGGPGGMMPEGLVAPVSSSRSRKDAARRETTRTIKPPHSLIVFKVV